MKKKDFSMRLFRFSLSSTIILSAALSIAESAPFPRELERAAIEVNSLSSIPDLWT